MAKPQILQCVIFCLGVALQAQSFPKAKMLYAHGLTPEAQKELIDLVFSSAPALAKEKPKAMDLLATIAFDKNNANLAYTTWNKLISDYPNSPEAKTAKERLPLLKNLMGKFEEENLDNSIAKSYMRSADFWSNGRDHGFKIDTSFLSPVEAAIYWYDRIISEFPNTPSSRVAYEEKMRTILGWREPGQYGDKYGVKLNRSYITQLESTFRLYESSFPEASEIQGFRYLISQAYWNQKDWIKTREWLNEIIQKDGNANSFYKDLASHRLLKIEY